MAARNEQRVLFCGFRRIENIDEYFKRCSILRGSNLYAGNHVYGVREEISCAAGPSDIFGKCIAQMKSADYDVRLTLSAKPRWIVEARCTCKAGCRGWCKHAAALALFVNNSVHSSCTDLPCAWLKPSSRPTVDTKKQTKELFPGKNENALSQGPSHNIIAIVRPGRPLPVPVLKALSASEVHAQFPDIRCAFTDVLQRRESDIFKESGAASPGAVEEVSSRAASELVRAIVENGRAIYSMMEVINALPLRVKRCDMLSALPVRERTFYEKFVQKSIDEIIEIELMTRGQGTVKRFVFSLHASLRFLPDTNGTFLLDTRWHQERIFRITSSAAHRIKTREAEFEALADALATPRAFATAATTYGKNTEDVARQELSMLLQVPIHEVGLVIHPKQHWLCCSPDGIISTNNTTRAVEIKCPFSLKDSELIDADQEVSYVKYIHYVNGKLTLRKTHPYFTQVMVILYVLNIQEVHLFVYSKKQSLSLIVERDEKFLSEYIPKLEGYYFKYLLKRLTDLSKENVQV
ncbi:uncharacterized protein LOC142578107 [Dermacentor variabilis]|uniref:uncharacterized protein LOC142578107 n=1 Tax=Dermacentor variabilis TaxID=34621 RepID=UPI003F5BB2DF